MDYILNPWPWFVSGPLIATVMFLLVSFGKTFGMSSNLRTLCSIGGAGKITSFFDFDWKEHQWNLWVVVGSIIGGFVAVQFLSNTDAININPGLLAGVVNWTPTVARIRFLKPSQSWDRNLLHIRIIWI